MRTFVFLLIVLICPAWIWPALADARQTPAEKPSPALYRTLGQVADPGPLAKPHADLESLDKCGKCHELNVSIPDANCLECHKDIRRLKQEQRGLHSRTKDLCIKCHIDHKGRDFDIVGLKKDDFDHKQQSGFGLEGRHKELKCEKCHNPEHIKDPSIKEERKKKTYMGLQSGCLDCHKDIHDGKLDKDCLKCHTMLGWKPKEGQQFTDILKFQHNRDSKFELVGAHKDLKCDKCHRPDPVRPGPKQPDMRIFKPLKHERCLDCHRDEHREQLGADCLKCHTTSAWTDEKGGLKFRHNRDSKFDLKGAHLDVKCDKCHKSATGKTYDMKFKPLKHAECLDCHKDEHEGRFERDCLRCHDMKTWKDYRLVWVLKDFDHGKLDFKLEGKHQKVECKKCHIVNNKPKFKKIAHETCVDCHKDLHRGQFMDKKCADCHKKIDWKELSFNHDDTRFKLARDHKEKKCVKCHEGGKYRDTPTKCTKCHSDSEDYIRGVVAGRQMGRPDPMAGLMECEKCHDQKTADQKTQKDQKAFIRKLCVDCHSEHYGKLFDYWDNRFDDTFAGFKKDIQEQETRKSLSPEQSAELSRLRKILKHERFHNVNLTRKLTGYLAERLREAKK